MGNGIPGLQPEELPAFLCLLGVCCICVAALIGGWRRSR